MPVPGRPECAWLMAAKATALNNACARSRA